MIENKVCIKLDSLFIVEKKREILLYTLLEALLYGLSFLASLPQLLEIVGG